MGRMNLETYKTIKEGIDKLIESDFTLVNKYDEILKMIQKENNFSDEDMEDYDAYDRCANENEIEEGHLTGYDCSICKNRGYMNSFYRQNGKLYFCAVDCTCKQIRRMFIQLEQSGIHKNQIEKYTFDNFQTYERWQLLMKKEAMYYVDSFKQDKNFDRWFFVSGLTGVGKSHIATATFIELIKLGKKCKYMLWKDDGDNLVRLKKGYDVDAFNKAINPYKVVEVLYIDDFLKLLPEGTVDRNLTLDIAYSIINARYANGLTTIISTEYTADELEGIDRAVFGRIRQMCIREDGHKYVVQIAREQNRDQRMK